MSTHGPFEYQRVEIHSVHENVGRDHLNVVRSQLRHNAHFAYCIVAVRL